MPTKNTRGSRSRSIAAPRHEGSSSNVVDVKVERGANKLGERRAEENIWAGCELNVDPSPSPSPNPKSCFDLLVHTDHPCEAVYERALIAAYASALLRTACGLKGLQTAAAEPRGRALPSWNAEGSHCVKHPWRRVLGEIRELTREFGARL